jgi:hypothetical protein
LLRLVIGSPYQFCLETCTVCFLGLSWLGAELLIGIWSWGCEFLATVLTDAAECSREPIHYSKRRSSSGGGSVARKFCGPCENRTFGFQRMQTSHRIFRNALILSVVLTNSCLPARDYYRCSPATHGL